MSFRNRAWLNTLLIIFAVTSLAARTSDGKWLNPLWDWMQPPAPGPPIPLEPWRVASFKASRYPVMYMLRVRLNQHVNITGAEEFVKGMIALQNTTVHNATLEVTTSEDPKAQNVTVLSVKTLYSVTRFSTSKTCSLKGAYQTPTTATQLPKGREHAKKLPKKICKQNITGVQTGYHMEIDGGTDPITRDHIFLLRFQSVGDLDHFLNNATDYRKYIKKKTDLIHNMRPDTWNLTNGLWY